MDDQEEVERQLALGVARPCPVSRQAPAKGKTDNTITEEIPDESYKARVDPIGRVTGEKR